MSVVHGNFELGFIDERELKAAAALAQVEKDVAGSMDGLCYVLRGCAGI